MAQLYMKVYYKILIDYEAVNHQLSENINISKNFKCYGVTASIEYRFSSSLAIFLSSKKGYIK